MRNCASSGVRTANRDSLITLTHPAYSASGQSAAFMEMESWMTSTVAVVETPNVLHLEDLAFGQFGVTNLNTRTYMIQSELLTTPLFQAFRFRAVSVSGLLFAGTAR